MITTWAPRHQQEGLNGNQGLVTVFSESHARREAGVNSHGDYVCFVYDVEEEGTSDMREVVMVVMV